MQPSKIFSNSFLYGSLALIAGMLLTVAFAPFHIFPLAILCPAILVGAWLQASPKQAFWRGYLFGLGHFTTGIYWVYISIHTFGQASFLLSSIITISLIAILALFPAYTGYLLKRFFPLNNSKNLILAFPALWTLLEWARSLIATGFPWLLLGYSQTTSPLKGYAPILSVYGVSLAVLISSGILVNLALQYKTHRKNMIYSLVGLIVIWLTGAVLCFIPWTQPTGKPIQISLVQGSIPQELKWSEEALQPSLDRYEQLTQPHWDSQIIIWPEAAIPLALQDAGEFLLKIDQAAKQHKTTVITGIPFKVPQTDNYLNAIITLGEGSGFYAKRHLVPFGEYTPFKNVLQRLLTSLNIPMSDFIPWTQQGRAFSAGGTTLSANICYEVAYPELVLNKNETVGMLFTVSNDAWFGQSIAQAQHLQTAQLRALEMRRPMLFAGNNGITAIIQPDGNIQSTIPPYVPGVLTDKVQARSGLTPWQRSQIDPLLIILLLMLGIARRWRK